MRSTLTYSTPGICSLCYFYTIIWKFKLFVLPLRQIYTKLWKETTFTSIRIQQLQRIAQYSDMILKKDYLFFL